MAAMAQYATGGAPPVGATGAGQEPERPERKRWTLGKLRQAYEEYLGSKQEEITEAQSARCYRHGAQWTTKQVDIFNNRRQPVVTYNRIGRKIDAIVGLMERIKLDPKAYPRNPRATDEMGAALATAVVRYVVDADLRESIFPFAIGDGATEGICGVEMLLIKGDRGDTDVGFAMVQPDSFFYDPRSYLHDFSDARFMGQGKWLDVDDAKAMFPGHEAAIDAMGVGEFELTSNPERERRWFQNTEQFKRVRVVELWYKIDDGWAWAAFMGSAILDEGDSYFFNEKKEEICKFIMFSSFVDHAGDRYGFVRGLRSSQDEINQRRSKGLHELNSRRILAEDGAFTDVEVARREAVRPDGVVIKNKGFEAEFDDQARIANVEGQLKFLEDAKNEVENFGPNPALIGQGLEYKSGRAINYLQQAGIAELGPFMVGVRYWKLRIYRAIWCAVQRYWSAERWIRVVDDEGVSQYVQLNGVGIDPQTGLPQLVNALGNLDVNFVLDEGPDVVNQMADAYDTLVALSSQGAKVPPAILLELAPLPAQQKRKLLAMLNKPDPMQQQAAQLEIGKGQAEIQESQSKAALNMAKAREAAQGGAHGVIERQMDAQMKGQEHQMKMVEIGSKVQAQRESAQIKAQSEFSKLQTQRVKSQQDLQTNQIKNVQSLRQGEEQHQQRLRQQAQKPKPNGGKR